MFAKQKFSNKLCLQNKNVHTSYVFKTKQKFYKQVMFKKQNLYIKVRFTKQKFTNTLCLQNKSLQTSYVYKTKQNKKCTDKLCLINKTIQTVNVTVVVETTVFPEVVFYT